MYWRDNLFVIYLVDSLVFAVVNLLEIFLHMLLIYEAVEKRWIAGRFSTIQKPWQFWLDNMLNKFPAYVTTIGF